MLRHFAVEVGRGSKAKLQSQTGEGVILQLGVQVGTSAPSNPDKHAALGLCVRPWVEESTVASTAVGSG